MPIGNDAHRGEDAISISIASVCVLQIYQLARKYNAHRFYTFGCVMSTTLEGQIQGTPSAHLSSPSSSMNKPMHAQGTTSTGAYSSPNAMNMAQNSSQQHPHNMSQYMNSSFTNSASSNQTSATYSPPKTQFNQSYQMQHHNIPATQSLPASQAVQPAVVPAVGPDEKDKPQSNGTTDGKTIDSMPKEQKDKERENHVTASAGAQASPPKNSVSNANVSEKTDKAGSEPVKTILEPAEVPQVTAASTMPSSATVTSASNASLLSEKQDDKTLSVKNIVKGALVTPPSVKTATSTSSASPQVTDSKDTSYTTTDTKLSPQKVVAKNEASDKKADKSGVEKDVAQFGTATTDKDKEKFKEKDIKETKQEAQTFTAAAPSTPTTPQKPKEQSTPAKSPIKVATTPRTPQRRSRTPKSETESPRITQKSLASGEPKPSTSKSPGGGKTKRARVRTQPYQSPLPELEILSKMSHNSTTPKSNESKLIVFYKQEFLAVRNSEGGFFVCQAVQNVYKSSARIKIRWLSQEKNDKSGEIYTPDFYDFIDFECILTNLELSKVDKGKFRLPPKEKERTDSILKRAIAVEKGEAISLDDSLTEDNPDGLDVSLYTEEDQLVKRKGSKRKLSKGRPASSSRTPSKRDPKAAKTTAKITPKKTPGRKASAPATEPRKSTAGGRAERAKRRSAPEGTKTSPVIDNKKAKVLAKVVKRTATATASTQSPKIAAASSKSSKAKVTETKATKQQPVASTSKAKIQKTTPPPTRKTPKRGRK